MLKEHVCEVDHNNIVISKYKQGNNSIVKEDFSKYNRDGTELRAAQMRLLDMLIVFDRICKKHDIEYFISGGTCLGAVRHGGFIPWDDDLDIDVMYKDVKKLTLVLKEELPSQYFLQTPGSEIGYYHTFPRIVDKSSRMHYPSKYKARKHLTNHGLFLDIFPLQRHIMLGFKRKFDKRFVTLFRFSRGIGGTPFKRGVAKTLYPVANAFVHGMNWISSLKILNVFNNQKISHIYGTNIVPSITYDNVFPTKPITFEGHSFSGPAKPHEYLTELYGDYMKIPPPEKRGTHSVKIELF